MWHTNEISRQYTNNARGRYSSVAENSATNAAEASCNEGDEDRCCDPKELIECRIIKVIKWHTRKRWRKEHFSLLHEVASMLR